MLLLFWVTHSQKFCYVYALAPLLYPDYATVLFAWVGFWLMQAKVGKLSVNFIYLFVQVEFNVQGERKGPKPFKKCAQKNLKEDVILE